MDTPLSTDLAARIAQGLQQDGPLPLITEYGEVLAGSVWQGGCVNDVPARTDDGDEFDLVISLYPWGKYAITAARTARLEIPFYDTGELDIDLVRQAANLAAAYLRKGGKVLIHCQGGHNRSSFVLAVLLIEHVGMSPREAISEIRKRRSISCLYNGAFERQLLRLPSHPETNSVRA